MTESLPLALLATSAMYESGVVDGFLPNHRRICARLKEWGATMWRRQGSQYPALIRNV